jgi:predicted secreted protein
MNRLGPTVRRLAVAAAIVVLAGFPSVNDARADDTVLRLSETATVMVMPDEIAATMRAEATAPTAQEAQKRVNEMMRDAVDAAKKVDGITVSTGAYNAWRIGPTPVDRGERWQAGQSLDLSGKDGESMLKLVGDLQQKGLVQGSLVWRISRNTEREARKSATKQALSALRARADEAAEVLGLRFSSFREVRLDSVAPPPVMPRLMAVTRASVAAPAPPPTAEAENMPVSASADADILLKPR